MLRFVITFFVALLLGTSIITTTSCNSKKDFPSLDKQMLAQKYFQEDTQWYLDNVPFFECSDQEIEQVYYYRWKLYKAHIRNTGNNKYVITEFINHVAWDRDPFCTINAASMHHIYEGRWLKDSRYINGYIDYLNHEGGNNRQYSEGIADASYANYLVTMDSTFIINQLDSMIIKYNGWSDHWDSTKNLYWIPAMPDATEYTIASIDQSGGTAGFDGGEAFRPTINSYMYGNAMAISHIAALKGDQALRKNFLEKANALRANINTNLFNDSLKHYTDRHKADNEFVHYWNFIRGRELAGMIPWYYNVPLDEQKYADAWKHVLDTSELIGKYGFRTNEPSYQYYFKQYVYTFDKPGSQWNGPSWPYQSSQVLTAMAKLLHDYSNHAVTNSDYLHLLRLFTRQHFLADGKINLVENYHPDQGGPIVHFYWSNHYNHSSYNNLIIEGLCGIQPSSDQTLIINPLIDSTIEYFFLEDVSYHGHSLTLVYDRDGTRYQAGKGLRARLDGKEVSLTKTGNGYKMNIGAPIQRVIQPEKPNYALNIRHNGYPLTSASTNNVADSLAQAVDGRIWYFDEITNYWSTENSVSTVDWYDVDFGKTATISELVYYPVAGKKFSLPDSITIQYMRDKQWNTARIKSSSPVKPVRNSPNHVLFDPISADRVRLLITHTKGPIAISEIQYY